MTFVLSNSESVNTYGFRIDLAGMDLERFRANPVMLYGHDPELVIGRWENIRLSADGKQLLADAVFDSDEPFAAEIQRKVEQNFIRGCSVGIRVLEMIERESVVIASRTELMEASVVSVPADGKAGVVLFDNNYRRLEQDAASAFVLSFNQNTNNMTTEELSQQLQAANERMQQLEAQVNTLQQLREQFEAKQAQVLQLREQLEAEQQPKTISLQAQLHNGAQPANNERTGWSFLRWAKEDPEGLARMKAEQPEEYQALIGD
ncbi:MAG: HK97 family phage prohead protease [Paludibacteraceae bacterium]|nr:HK97 family phage prohead protease [Paludibacteraceae bacterium]